MFWNHIYLDFVSVFIHFVRLNPAVATEFTGVVACFIFVNRRSKAL